MSLVSSLNIGISALDAFSQGMQLISNNIANVNTTGYKDARPNYTDSFSNILRQSAPAPSSGNGSNTPPVQIGAGVQLGSITTEFTQGTLSSTGVNTDLAVSGSGFFTVRDPASGTSYVTRAGNFSIDSQGYLVTSQGYRVQGLSDGGATYTATNNNGALSYAETPVAPATVGDIKIDFSTSVGNGLTNNTGGAFTDAQVNAGAPTLQSFTVDTAGNVVIGLSNGDTVDRGKVLLQNFSSPNALTKAGNNLYTGFAAAGPIGGTTLSASNNGAGTNGLGSIQVGALELSNVDLSQEMTNIIVAERSFQSASRIVTVTDTMLQDVVDLKH